MAKAAFLFVIEKYDSFRFDKKQRLEDIAQKCPEVLDAMTDDELFQGFNQHIINNNRKNAVTSVADMDWVSQYIKDECKRYKIEKTIFTHLLRASCRTEMRRKFNWTISAEDRIKLVRFVLSDPYLEPAAKMELAIEFGELAEEYIQAHYCKLLYNREYNEAAKLQVVKAEDATINVIVANVCAGYFDDALAITERFLSHRKDIVQEIHQIQDAFRS